MKKNEGKQGQKDAGKRSTKAKVAKAAGVAAETPGTATATEAAPIAAQGGQERVSAANAGAGQKKAKTVKAKKAPAEPKAKKTSGLDAAAQVLKDAGQPMNAKAMVETMLAKGMWKTGGKTPAATIYASVLREIQTKGDKARFKKADRGLFAFNG